MVFSSPVFLFLFLPIVLLLVWSAGTLNGRNTILTVASLFFYAWGETIYVWVMLASILLNHGMGIWLGADMQPERRRLVLALAVLINLGMLAWFKYANFIADNLTILIRGFGGDLPDLDPVKLPIGISFFTFQGLSYVIDVYRGDVAPQRRPGNVALYISFFPQLIAGPIVRYTDIAREMEQRNPGLADVAVGIRRFIIGLGKKLLIADNVALVADRIFDLPGAAMPASVAWLGGVAFAIQIYFDFSGYSDMAIGLGRIFGFHFLENFNYPYIATNMRDFWQRWHISLTTWFRDYVYIPLGGSRGGTMRTYANLLIIFFITGLWHGASWNFVLWGMFHGAFLIIERLGFQRIMQKLPGIVGNLYVLVVLQFSWIFFHTDDMTEAWNYARSMLGVYPDPSPYIYPSIYLDRQFIICALVGALCATPLLRDLLARVRTHASSWSGTQRLWAKRSHSVLDVLVHVCILLLCVMHMATSTYDPFIYFRF